MDKRHKIAEILLELKQLDGKLLKQMTMLLEQQFGWKGELTEAILLEWDEANFEMFYNVTSGIRMTREYVPDIVSTYKSVQHLNGDYSQVRFRYTEAQHDEKPERPSKPDAQYGSYELPLSIRKLFELERERGIDWMSNELGLMPLHEDMRYETTPPDFIPFASPGMDGIHYCFVTDYGKVKDLEEAYVAVVSPMDFGRHIWFAARNIRDFVRIWCSDRTMLLNYFADGAAYREFGAREGISHEGEAPEKEKAGDALMDALALSPIEDIPGYMDWLREQRDQQICIRTLDTIGVVPMQHGAWQGEPAGLPFDLTDPALLSDMLRHAVCETKLAVIRDLQFTGRIYERSEYRLAKRILVELDLYQELYNLKASKG